MNVPKRNQPRAQTWSGSHEKLTVTTADADPVARLHIQCRLPGGSLHRRTPKNHRARLCPAGTYIPWAERPGMTRNGEAAGVGRKSTWRGIAVPGAGPQGGDSPLRRGHLNKGPGEVRAEPGGRAGWVTASAKATRRDTFWSRSEDVRAAGPGRGDGVPAGTGLARTGLRGHPEHFPEGMKRC